MGERWNRWFGTRTTTMDELQEARRKSEQRKADRGSTEENLTLARGETVVNWTDESGEGGNYQGVAITSKKRKIRFWWEGEGYLNTKISFANAVRRRVGVATKQAIAGTRKAVRTAVDEAITKRNQNALLTNLSRTAESMGFKYKAIKWVGTERLRILITRSSHKDIIAARYYDYYRGKKGYVLSPVPKQ